MIKISSLLFLPMLLLVPSFNLNAADTSVRTPDLTVSITAREDKKSHIRVKTTGLSGKLSYQIVENVKNGKVTHARNSNRFTYRPNPNFNGRDEFQCVVQNEVGDQQFIAVQIEVVPENDPPTVHDQSAIIGTGKPLDLTLEAEDIDSDSLAFKIVSPPEQGELSGKGPRMIYTPGPYFEEDDYFLFQATDGQALSNVGTFTIRRMLEEGEMAAEDATKKPN